MCCPSESGVSTVTLFLPKANAAKQAVSFPWYVLYRRFFGQMAPRHETTVFCVCEWYFTKFLVGESPGKSDSPSSAAVSITQFRYVISLRCNCTNKFQLAHKSMASICIGLWGTLECVYWVIDGTGLQLVIDRCARYLLPCRLTRSYVILANRKMFEPAWTLRRRNRNSEFGSFPSNHF